MALTIDSAPFSIRQAAPSDALALAGFAAAAFADTFAADNTPADMAAYRAEAFGEERQRAELADPACTVLLAERGDTLMGYAMLREGAAPAGVNGIAPGNAMEIARLYAGKRWIGTGVGAALMQHCLDLATERAREWVWLGVWERNERAQAFYRKYGFRKVGSQIFVVGTDPQTDHVMLREL